MTAVLLALVSALFFGGMSVGVRIALDRGGQAIPGAFVTVATALIVAIVFALMEAPSRGVHLTASWPFLLSGIFQPGVGQLFATLAIREAGASRTSMVFGTAPLLSVAIALLFLGESATVPLLVGALLVVAGSVELARERDRPVHIRRIGLAYAVVTVVLFAARDNLIRWLAGHTASPPAVSTSASLIGAVVLLAVAVRPRISRRGLLFVPAGLSFGLSYVALFEAYYRGRVTVVSPLVATEALFAVGMSVLLLRHTELVGRRLALGAVCIVAGGALIGVYR